MTAVNVGSATLVKVNQKQAFSVLCGTLKCLAAVQVNCVFRAILLMMWNASFQSSARVPINGVYNMICKVFLEMFVIK